MVRISAIAVCVIVLVVAGHAEKKPEQLAEINFVVVKDDNGQPVRNASVVLHPVGKSGKQARGGYELKTDPDGKGSFSGVPFGTLRVQVIAPGFQTYGEDFAINQKEQAITIKLKRPEKQYSIYDK